MRCQTFSFSFFPCSADHERDWPPCKVVFFGLATNALNVRNNNNNNNNIILKTLKPSLWRGLHQYTSVLRDPIMLRKAREAVPEGNNPVPQKEELGSGQLTLADIYGLCVERFDRMDSYSDRWNKKLDEISDEMKKMDKNVTRVEQGARQPRLVMEADRHADTKTRERTEGAATAVQAMRGDCFSARRVEPGPTTNSTSFGVKPEPPALPCRDDSVVECGAAASESCLPSLEMRSSTVASGLVPSGEASTASGTTLNEPHLRICPTEETDLEPNCKKTLTLCATFDNSSFWRLLAAPYCRRAVDPRSRQNITFDPGGSRGHLHACLFLGSWCALVCGKVLWAWAAGEELQRFFGGDSLGL